MSLAEQSQQWYPTSVKVTVLQAKGLRIKGKNGTNDAYAIMQVAKDKFSTSVAEKSVSPVWKEEATFDLPLFQQAGGDHSTLHVQVMHRVLMGMDKMLGQAIIDLVQLQANKSRSKTDWYKLLNKSGKQDKERGEVQLDIQFLRSNLTASMYDLSTEDKPRSRMGKLKDKLRGKHREGQSDSVSAIVPSVSQGLTDSEGEEGNGGDARTGTQKSSTSLLTPKTNLQRNISQSMSHLGSGSEWDTTSEDHQEPQDSKKKFGFLTHKRSGSSDSKVSQGPLSLLGRHKQAPTEQITICINGSHVYNEEPQTKTTHTGSALSLTGSPRGSTEDLHRAGKGDTLKGFEKIKPEKVEQERKKQEEQERERKRQEELEKERKRQEEQERERKRQEELERERKRQEEQDRERKRQEEQERERKKQEEQERKRREEQERKRQEELERKRQEELQKERKRQEELEKKKAEEQEKERKRQEQQERERKRQEEQEGERKRQEQQERKRQEEQEKLEEQVRERKRQEEQERERKRQEEQEKKLEEQVRERKRQEEQERERKRQEEQERERKRQEEQERKRQEEQERKRQEEQERERKRHEEQGKKNQEKISQEVNTKAEQSSGKEIQQVHSSNPFDETYSSSLFDESSLEELHVISSGRPSRLTRVSAVKPSPSSSMLSAPSAELLEEGQGLIKPKQNLPGHLGDIPMDSLVQPGKKKCRAPLPPGHEVLARTESPITASVTASLSNPGQGNTFALAPGRPAVGREKDLACSWPGKRPAPQPPSRFPLIPRTQPVEESSETGLCSSVVRWPESENEDATLESGTSVTGTAGLQGKEMEPTQTYIAHRLPGALNDDFTIKVPSDRGGSTIIGREDVLFPAGTPAEEGTTCTTKVKLMDPVPCARSVILPKGYMDRPEDSVANKALPVDWGGEEEEKPDGVQCSRLTFDQCAWLQSGPDDVKKPCVPMNRSDTDYCASVPSCKKKHAPAPPEARPSKKEASGNASKQCADGLGNFSDVDVPPKVTQMDKHRFDKNQAPSQSSKGQWPSDSSSSANIVSHESSEPASTTSGRRSALQDSVLSCDLQMIKAQKVDGGGGTREKESGPTSPLHRRHPVRPLRTEEIQSISSASVAPVGQDVGVQAAVSEKSKEPEAKEEGPYSQLTRAELVALLLKQQAQLAERSKKVSELEDYIDNLLVRVMEEKPSILMDMTAAKKAV